MKRRENIKKSIKEKINWKKTGKFLAFLAVNVLLLSQSVFATDTGANVITSGMQSLTDLVKAFISAVGVIITLWGVFEWGNAMQANDGMMQSAAFKRIGGGLVMVLAPQLLPLLVPGV